MRYVFPNQSFTAVFNIGEPGLTTVGVTVVNAETGAEITARSTVGVIETPAGSGIYSKTADAPSTEQTYIAIADVDGDAPFAAYDFVVATEIPFIEDIPDGLLDRFKERVETDIDDDELVRMLIEARTEIALRYGPGAVEVEEYVEGRTRSIAPARIVDATEALTVTEDGTELETTDYRIENGGRTLVRTVDGQSSFNLRWGDEVKLEYTPFDDTAQRDESTIKLASLALQYEGGRRYDRVGDASAGYAVWSDERNSILRELSSRKGLTMF